MALCKDYFLADLPSGLLKDLLHCIVLPKELRFGSGKEQSGCLR